MTSKQKSDPRTRNQIIQKEDPTPKSSPLPPANRKYVKKTYGGRPDGGPTTRSKAVKLISLLNTYAEVVKGQTI
jgi:hypothetical protein